MRVCAVCACVSLLPLFVSFCVGAVTSVLAGVAAVWLCMRGGVPGAGGDLRVWLAALRPGAQRRLHHGHHVLPPPPHAPPH